MTAFIAAKRVWYGIHEAQMPLLGRCVSVGTFVLNYGVTIVAPTLKDQPIVSSKRTAYLQTQKRAWNDRNFGHVPRLGTKTRTVMYS
jgi:hypothetical protein